ncbi:MAG: D-cysteine desulfhydrase family protein [Anaerolineae bacterium]
MNAHPIPPGSFLSRLDAIPRLDLAQYPTRLEFLPCLSRELGRRIYIKRDDEIGPGLGGNKTRKLEYLMADALRQGARKVVTFGGLQSNHARITAAVARRVGMEPHLFYFERRPSRMDGNLLLNQLLGARLHFIPFGGRGGMTVEASSRLVHLVAWALVGPHYFIPVGGHNRLGALGYVRAALEINAQAGALGIEEAWLIVAAGSGGTLAGLMAGLALAGSSMKLLGIDVGKLWQAFPASIARLANELCIHLGSAPRFQATGVPLIEQTYVGERYGVPSAQGLAAIRTLAQTEGIFLDPIYTGKAFAGMLDLVSQGQLGRDEPVIFLHTGGIPALFALHQTQS